MVKREFVEELEVSDDRYLAELEVNIEQLTKEYLEASNKASKLHRELHSYYVNRIIHSNIHCVHNALSRLSLDTVKRIHKLIIEDTVG